MPSSRWLSHATTMGMNLSEVWIVSSRNLILSLCDTMDGFIPSMFNNITWLNDDTDSLVFGSVVSALAAGDVAFVAGNAVVGLVLLEFAGQFGSALSFGGLS